MSILQSFVRNTQRIAVSDAYGAFTYADILSGAVHLRQSLQDSGVKLSVADQPRIAYAVPRDHRYVISKCTAWLAGGIGVPIAENHPVEEVKYTLQDSGASVVFACPERLAVVQPAADALGIPVLPVPKMDPATAPLSATALAAAVSAAPSESDPSRGAFMIYTSGTTGRPKGVLTTHEGLMAQVHAMGTAWEWTRGDRIYSVLPLHHVHGIVAIVLTGLAYGAAVELAPRFDASACWEAMARPVPASPEAAAAGTVDPRTVQPTLFMAVPTVYSKMLEAHGKLTGAQAGEEGQAKAGRWQTGVTRPDSILRLMVSGSAALPESVARAWRELTGHSLLERYGMTEFAMALSNPYRPSTAADGKVQPFSPAPGYPFIAGPRKLNTVGYPLPGFEARLVPEEQTEGGEASATTAAGGGELQIRGPGVFTLYWGRPEATKESFTPDGWFKTGDRAIQDGDGYYSIQGRLSADILKCGGYKISALDIERELLEHAGIAEVAVVGLPDPTWGDRVAAIVVLKDASGAAFMEGGAGAEAKAAGDGASSTTAPATTSPLEAAVLDGLRSFASKTLAPYKLPTVLRLLPEMPRNAMGKVNKKALLKQVFG